MSETNNSEYCKRYYEKNAERIRSEKLSSYHSNGGTAKQRLRKYGISQEVYDEILRSQKGVCAVCESTIKLCVDHDHETGAIRGILCNRCNLAIGNLGDTVQSVRRAIAYLESSNQEV